MAGLFFSSDLHFNHKKVAEIRAQALGLDSFDSAGLIAQHNEELIERWNTTVTPDDTTWLLGDVCMGDTLGSLELVRRLNGRKLLVTGNHDKVWPGHSTARKQFRAWLDVFDYITPFAKIKLNGRYAKLSHFPYEGDHTAEERFSDYRPVDNGDWLIHGHVHDLWKRNGRQINVGVDRWEFYPVSVDRIQQTIVEAEREWMDVGYAVAMGKYDWPTQ